MRQFLKGQIASVMGMPVIMSRFMAPDLNAAGKYDNVTKTKSGVLIFARESYYQYLRRGILVETQKDIRAGAIEIVATRSVMDTPDTADKKKRCIRFQCWILKKGIIMSDNKHIVYIVKRSNLVH